ncbi:SMEK domain-containing protein [Pedobacter sp. 22226]|uniref:SMEK domain-containing protein n=1 Tax=Pedobacter sp. 22226 TaxID=3453894 RepID=UPI003F845A9E
MDKQVGAFDAQNRIIGFLARLDNMLVLSNSNGQNSLSTMTEGLVSEILSTLFEVPFISANREIANYPGIDLECQDQKIAVQVTSNKESSKVSQTIEIFLKRGFHNVFSRLMIVVLANKDYQQDKISAAVAKLNKKMGTDFAFDIQSDIIDLRKLNKLIGSSGSEKIIAIHNILRRYMDGEDSIAGLQDYFQKLKALYYQPVMDEDSGMTLSGIYVEPAFLVHTMSGQVGAAGLKFADDKTHDFELVEEISIHRLLEDWLCGSGSYSSYFLRPNAKVAIIMGYPGQGKTSMCKRLVHDLLGKEGHRNVFYVRLKDIIDTRSLIHSPFNVICDDLAMELGSDFDRDMLKNSITVLDGLDELYMKDNLKADDIETFVKDVIRTAERLETWNVIITTRYGYINFNRLYKENYLALLLKPLDLSQQLIWLDKYRLFHPEAWIDKGFISEVNDEGFGPVHFLKEVINQPLLLYIIASLKNRIDIQSGRTEIYNMLFDQIIDRRYSNEGQIENLRGLTRDELRFMLQEIAYLIFKSGAGFLSSDEVLGAESLKDVLAKIGDGHLSDSLKGILISFYFKEVKDPRSLQSMGIEFFHKSLQEYLTAERIVEIVFSEVLNRDIRGNYILKKGQQLLVFLNDVFGAQEITTEIWDFIKDLLAKKDLAMRDELSQRLSAHIEYLFEKDFILEFGGQQVDPVRKMLLTFRGYWTFMRLSFPDRDYIQDRTFARKFFAYAALAMNLDPDLHFEMMIAHQTFNDARSENLIFVAESVKNAQFSNASLGFVQFMDCNGDGMAFLGSELQKLLIDDTTGKILVESCRITSLELRAYVPMDLTFNACYFLSETAAAIRNGGMIRFVDCVFTKRAYQGLQKLREKLVFRNCEIEEEKTIGKRFETVVETSAIPNT